MSKRHLRPHPNMNRRQTMRVNPKPAMCLNREKAEKICQQKLREVSKAKSKLFQSVLVRKTLKYVQNSEYVTFACDKDFEDDEYEIFRHIK